ncbi:MAG: DUF2892 domain-containing protein [Ignavibacteria bacterium]|nr:MAG: DUF2892 domain-containing protein [Ignavibacteria bacterium]
MNKNIGSVDRIIRYVVGVAALGLGYYYNSYWGLLGLIPILTATINFCPLYAPFKISTRKGE